jgi:hypothetical protein
MRVFITGSIAGHKPGVGQAPAEVDDTLFKAGHDIGYEAAKAGYDILLRNVGSPNVIDGYILDGVREYCHRDPARRASVELHLPEHFPLNVDPVYPGIQIMTFRYPSHGVPSRDDYYATYYLRFLASTIGVVDRCDTAVTVGDGETVTMVGSLAALGKARVLAIASFGGSSRDVFEQNRALYASRWRENSAYSVLTEKWSGDSARRVIELIDELASHTDPPHTYFISYAHEDAAVADHLELLLRRRNRHVLRDETGFLIGDRFPDSIGAMIIQCNTFLVVGSAHYTQSDWCKLELAYASEKKAAREIIYVDVDRSDPPIQVSGRLRILAVSRENRLVAVERLISEETGRRRIA